MALTNAEIVTQLYVGYYDRAPDPEGLQYWIGRIEAGVSLADIANSFATSPEAIATYPFFSFPELVSAETFLKSVYLNLFGRAIDADGLAYYSAQLSSGTTPVGQILAQIIGNATTNEGSADQKFLANKVSVGLDWATSAANKPGFTFNDAAKNSASTVLDGVNATDASVAAAKAATVDFFNAPTANLGPLTTGLDTIQGTVANELIRADQNTLQATDTIDGGAGTDTFEYTYTGTVSAALPAAQVKNVEIINVRNAGSAATSTGTKETATFTFSNVTIPDVAPAVPPAVANADTVTLTIGGRTVTLNGAVGNGAGTTFTAQQIAEAFSAGAGTYGSITVADAGGAAVGQYNVTSVTNNSITFTAAAEGDKTGTDQLSVVVGGTLTPAPATPTFTVVNGTVAPAAAAVELTLDANNFAGATEFNSTNSTSKVIVKNVSGSQSVGLNSNGDAKIDFEQTSGTTTTVNVSGGTKAGATIVNTGASVATATINSKGAAANEVAIDLGTGANVTKLTVNAASNLKASLGADYAATGADLVVAGAATSVDLGANGTFKTIDASGLVGGLTIETDSVTTSLKGGNGKDVINLSALAANATVATGAGEDTVTVSGALAAGTKIDLGAGNDKLLFATGGSIANSTATATTVIDGGDGIDTLALELVGAANVGIFKNFEVFDVISMTAKTLDLDILAANNTVNGITGSGALAGAVTLTNLGAGVGFTALADLTAAQTLTLSQKTAGALTVTLDADKTSTTAQNDAQVKVVASNATSLKAAFDSNSGFVQTNADKNDQKIDLTGTKATSLEVVSGGANASNELVYTIGNADGTANNGLLTSATVTGSQDLNLDFVYNNGGGLNTGVNKLATVDASAFTGKLTFDLADLGDKGTIKLGSGADLVKVGATSILGGIESIEGFSKSTSATNADAIKLADKLGFTAATVGTEATASANLDVAKGVVTFVGTGPTTLDEAVSFVNAAVTTVNGVVAFQYINDTYIFQQNTVAGTADDVVVKLTGITGVTELGLDGTNLFLV